MATHKDVLTDASALNNTKSEADGSATTTWYEIEDRDVNSWPHDNAWPISVITNVTRLGRDGHLYFAPGSSQKSLKRNDRMYPSWELAVEAYLGRLDALAAKLNEIRKEGEQVLSGGLEAYLLWRKEIYGE